MLLIAEALSSRRETTRRGSESGSGRLTSRFRTSLARSSLGLGEIIAWAPGFLAATS
jgi:hypothetical protein